MNAQFSKRALTAGLGVSALGLLAQTQPTSADTPFTTFPFPATGAPTSRTMPDRLADFVNVKDYGAHGNGSANDTAAIQAALDAAYGPSSSPNGGMGAAKNRAVFFPSGSYIITSPLTLRSAHGAHVFGAGRFTTTITNTTSGGTVFKTNGCEYSRFERMQLIATGAGSICFDLNWNNTGSAALQGNTFCDMYFQSANYGLRIGGLNNDGFMGSENLIMNCHFSGNEIAGVYTGNYNAIQQTIIGGNFQSCGIGIYNKYGTSPVIIGVGFQLNQIDINVENTGTPGGDGYFIFGCRSESTTTFLVASPDPLIVHVSSCSVPNAAAFTGGMGAIRLIIDACSCLKGTIGTGRAGTKLYIRGSNFGNPNYLANFGGTVMQNI
jgi:hypothetical protein